MKNGFRNSKIQDYIFPLEKTVRKKLIGKCPYKNYYFIGPIRTNKKKGSERVKIVLEKIILTKYEENFSGGKFVSLGGEWGESLLWRV